MWPSKNPRELFFNAKNTLNPNEIMTRLPLTINNRYVSSPARARWNLKVFGEEFGEIIRLSKPGTGLLKVTWRKRENHFEKKIIKFFCDCPFFYIDPHKFFQYCVDNSYLHKEWNFDLILSNTHWCSFSTGSVKSKVAESPAGKVVLLHLLSIHDGAVGMMDLDVMLLWLWISTQL